jgi:hypothetical protein
VHWLTQRYQQVPAGARVWILAVAGLLPLVANLVGDYSMLARFVLATATSILWMAAFLEVAHQRGGMPNLLEDIAVFGVLAGVVFGTAWAVETSSSSSESSPSAADPDTRDHTESTLVGVSVTQGLTAEQFSDYTGFLELTGSRGGGRKFLIQVRGNYQTEDLKLDFRLIRPDGGKQFNATTNSINCRFNAHLATCTYDICSCGGVVTGERFVVRALLRDDRGNLLDQLDSKAYVLQPRSTKKFELTSVSLIQDATDGQMMQHAVNWGTEIRPPSRRFLLHAWGVYPPSDDDLDLDLTYHRAKTGKRVDVSAPYASCYYYELKVAACGYAVENLGDLKPGESFFVRVRLVATSPKGSRRLIGQVDSKPYRLSEPSANERAGASRPG